jgi:CheY-like chemotaxis protein
MEIICQSCKGKLKIPDEKLPAGKTASIKCPRCQSKISIKVPEESVADVENEFDDLFAFDEDEGESYDAVDKPFDFIEEEGKTALVCESDALIREKISPILHIMEYHVTEVPSSRETLKKMRYHTYDIVILNEYFDSKDVDTNPILIYLERMMMEIRRNMFVVLLTTRFRTMDNMMAFQKSVNMILNLRNIDDMDKILQRGLADYGLFFKVFKETLTANQ